MSKTKKLRTKRNTSTRRNKKRKEDDSRCKKYSNSFSTFEDKIDKIYGDIFSSKDFNLEKTIVSELKKAVSPSNINPQNDFYSYINERWMNDKELPEEQKYIVQIDEFRLVQDKVYRELLEIVKNYVKTEKSKKAAEVRNFYHSLLRLNTDKESTSCANNMLKEIDSLRQDKGNVWKLLGLTNKNDIISWGSPIMWTLNPDDKQPNIFRCFIDSPQVSLIDLEIYFNDGTEQVYKRKYIERFMLYLGELFEHTFGKNHGFNVSDVFAVEVKILNAMGCDYIKGKKAESTYNKVTTKEAMEKYNFDWKSFSAALGFDNTPDFFITGNLNYLKCGTDLLLKEWNTEEWRTYWIYIFIRQQQRWNYGGREIVYNFLGNFVRGQESGVHRELAPIYGLGYAFNTLLTNKYIEKYENKQLVDYVKTMAEDLKTVFIRIIRRNKWLQPKTKEKALKKLTNFNLVVGSPKLLREDPVLDYSSTDAWGNMMKISAWRHDKAIKLEGKHVIDIPVMDWAQVPPKFVGTQAYVVNASYTPSKNGIYIPLGYIQKPFVDLEERGIEYNLAHIGFTLGHEMSHALDDWGSQYDETGKLNNWWTNKDRKKFKQIQDDVIKQYEVFAGYDKIKFDASISIGEDLADISGLTICREYLRDFQLKNEDILPIQSLSFEAFFVYFAYQMRQKIGQKAIQAQLKTNPHPLDKYRTNVPLSRMPLFREIYGIKKGDKMWWHSTNRVWE
jgi:predicted metalloendopeptidase